MKDPKYFKNYADIPVEFHDALRGRVGGLMEIKKLNRKEIVMEQVGWKLGDHSWYGEFESWLNKAGLEIVEVEE